jgi:hypothetical protein
MTDGSRQCQRVRRTCRPFDRTARRHIPGTSVAAAAEVVDRLLRSLVDREMRKDREHEDDTVLDALVERATAERRQLPAS